MTLKPMCEQRVTFTLGYDELKEWSLYKKYELFGQRINIMVGVSSDNIIFEALVVI